MLALRFICSFLSATLFLVSSLFAMDYDRSLFQRKKRLINKAVHRQQQKSIELEQQNALALRQGLEKVLALFSDYAEHHSYMFHLISAERKKLDNDTAKGEFIARICGLTLDECFQNRTFDFDVYINWLHYRHVILTNYFKDIAASYQSIPVPILTQVAHLYARSIIVQRENDKSIESQFEKKSLDEIQLLSEIKTAEKFVEFSFQVQKKILDEFEPYLDEIYNQLVYSACFYLKMNLTDEARRFYQSVVNRTYSFPTKNEIQDQVCVVPPTVEETKKNGKRKKNIKRKNRKCVKSTTLLVNDNSSSETNVSEAQIVLPETKQADKAEASASEKLALTVLENKKEEQKTVVDFVETEHLTENNNNNTVNAALDEENSWKEIESKLQAQFEQDHKNKKRNRKNIVESKNVSELQISPTRKAEIGAKHYTFFNGICTTSLSDPNIHWSDLIHLFNGPSGFKGKVYGKGDGACNTFEVFLKFNDGNLVGFLSEEEFNDLKTIATPEFREQRSFLKENGRLICYRLPNGESIATSCFTLHNPHPTHCLYPALLQRLRDQLNLLGLNLQTIQCRIN